MIFLATFRFASRETDRRGEFVYVVEACSQEDAELRLCGILEDAVLNDLWFPAPCRFFLTRLVAVRSIPPEGIIIHHRLRINDIDAYPMPVIPEQSVETIIDWNLRDWQGYRPHPFMEIGWDRNVEEPAD